jgi:putative DNA primase/helicase
MLFASDFTSNALRIPADLRSREQWVLWRYEERDDGKRTKVPYQPNEKLAKVDTRATWRPYSVICDAWSRNNRAFAGIGFVFTADDPYVGIDLDKCLEDGEIKPWAQSYIERFSDTYMEISPSGKGIKIFTKGKLSGKGKRNDFGDHAIEVYDRSRFFTVTGRAFKGAPLQIEDHQTDIEWLYKFLSFNKQSNNGVDHRSEMGGRIPKGHRHDTLVSLAGTMRRRGMTVEEIDIALSTVNCSRCEPPYDRKHIRDIAESSGNWEPQQHAVEINLLCQPYTDTGNAERLITLHGKDIRFCSDRKKWLVWDGRRWNSEDVRRIKVLAKHTLREVYAQAAKIDGAEHPQRGEKTAAEKHARSSESAYGIKSMLACAEYEDGVPVSISELDRDKFLLNVLNGTLDLKSGRLREHRRGDLITKLVHFEYHPGGRVLHVYEVRESHHGWRNECHKGGQRACRPIDQLPAKVLWVRLDRRCVRKSGLLFFRRRR